MKKLRLSIAMLTLAVSLMGCGNDAENVKQNDDVNITDGVSETPKNKLDLSNVNVGDTIEFGKFDYGKLGYGDGVEKVQWDVLAKEDGRVLLISHYIVSLSKYDENAIKEKYDTNWEQSDIRAYLNDELINEMFTKDEQESILEVTIDNPNSDEYCQKFNGFEIVGNNNPCGETTDKLFLLSFEEVEKYYENHNDAKASSKKSISSDWYLRSTGIDGHHALYVNIDGNVMALFVNENHGVRPAMYVEY